MWGKVIKLIVKYNLSWVIRNKLNRLTYIDSGLFFFKLKQYNFKDIFKKVKTSFDWVN
jgi:hypothetical protein